MDLGKNNRGRTQFGDLAGTNYTGGQNACNPSAQIVDAKERKRKRERARYAAMSEEKRNERNKKRRESYQRKKKGQPKLLETFEGGGHAALNKENMDRAENNGWLHRNDSYKPRNVDEENISIVLPGDYTPGNVDNCNTIDLAHISFDLSPGEKCASKVRMQTLCATDSVNTVHNLDGVTPTFHLNNQDIQRGSRSIYYREQYKNMTIEERIARRERQRLHNMTEERKAAKRASKRRLRKL
ncbi:hypothetical protein ACP70R_004675 [Stipagrostis hirtigluma subsp. patula]